MTKDEIKAAISEISEMLKGPMPNLDRAFLASDRREMREALAVMDKEALEND